MFSNVLKGFQGGIRSKYAVSSRVSFTCGPWSVYSGKRKLSSSENGSPDAVSVFVFDKKAFMTQLRDMGVDRRAADEVLIRLRKEVTSLAKIRHPSTLRIVEPLEESKSSIMFVTEPVSTCLKSLIDAKNRGSSGVDDELDELVIQRGILQLCDGLIFIHETVGIVHLNLEPSSVLIDAKGDWKLFGFKFSENFKEHGEYYNEQTDPRLATFLQVNFDYAAPELLQDHKLDPSNDIFSLGCLILCIYNCHSPLSTNNNMYDYRDQLKTITRALRNSNIPSYFNSILPQLVKLTPMERISLQSLKTSEFFDNPLVKTINFLDDFPGKLASEKKVFLQGLQQMLPQFPTSTRQRKILQSLLEELGKDETVTYLLLKDIFIIGNDMSQLSFTEKVLPAVQKVKQEAGCQAAIIDSMDVLLSRLTAEDFQTYVLPILILVLQSSDPEHQRMVLASMEAIIEKLDYVSMKTEIFPAVCDVFSKTTSLSVKLESLKTFSVFIAHELDKHTITEKLIPLMNNMKTRESQIILAAVDIYMTFYTMIDVDALATQVLPQILSLSMESSLKKQQYRKIMGSLRTILEKIEEEKIKCLADGPTNVEPVKNVDTAVKTKSNQDSLTFDDLIKQPSRDTSQVSSTASLDSRSNANNDLLSFDLVAASPPSPRTPSLSTPPLQPMNKTPMNKLRQNSGTGMAGTVVSFPFGATSNKSNESTLFGTNSMSMNNMNTNKNQTGFSITSNNMSSMNTLSSFRMKPNSGNQAGLWNGSTTNRPTDSNEFGAFQNSQVPASKSLDQYQSLL